MKQILALTLALTAGIARSADGGDAGEHTKSFSVAKGGSLEVYVGSADLRVQGWEKDEVLVTVSGADEDEYTGITMRQSGNTVHIESSEDSGDYTISVRVPSRFDLRLRSSSGDIQIDGPLSGTMNGSTGGGNLQLGSIGGTVSMTTSGGDVTTADIQGDLDLKTSGGDIRMQSVSGSAVVTTAGGEIAVENVGKKLIANTAGGNISIGNVGGEASVSTAGGDIIAGVVSGNATLSTAGGNVSLRGATGRVVATTSGGDLELENITGSVEGNTSGGNITASLNPTRTGASHLNTAAGDIHLYVPEGARATISARIHLDGWHRSSHGEFDIRSDFPAEKYEKDERSQEIRASYRLNGGGEGITLEVSAGNIEIRKAKP